MSRTELLRPVRLAVVLSVCWSLGGGLAWGQIPKEEPTDLDARAFFHPDLALSSANVPLEEVERSLPNQAAWQAFRHASASQLPRGHALRVFIDQRSGAASNIVAPFPIVPGRGVGNRVTLQALGRRLGRPVAQVDAAAVAGAARAFVDDHAELIGIDAGQLGAARAALVRENLWHVNIPQVVDGVPVRYARISGTVAQGNLILVGADTWANVRVSTQPGVTAPEALATGFAHAGGRQPQDALLRQPTLEIVPVARGGDDFASAVGGGYDHRLVWTFVFQRPPDDARWEAMTDAHTGELLAFEDLNQYSSEQVKGGVYPMTSTEICPNQQQCGTMQSGWPMPFADTGLAVPNNFANSAGIFSYTSGTVTTTLTGKYVDINDNCGAISDSALGTLDLGGVNGDHDCTRPPGASLGDTSSSRSCFYEVNKIAELARGWLPTNPWLNARVTANVNINNTCNGFWNGATINFYRSGGGCRNTGELAGVFDHEWGHGLDDNDSGGVLSNTSEAYADIAAIYRLNTSCVGHGFWWTSNRGCGMTADGTGFNANENQVGGLHCDLDCSGVRDADYLKHSPNTPDTAAGFVCSQCDHGSGPCKRQVHCAAAPVRQAAWDLVARDLQAAPFSLDSQTALLIGNKLFYEGSGNVGSWYACNCGPGTSSGCASTNGYMQWLAADDDNGSVSDGTPHMTALHAAFNRHGIACSTPTPTNSGCGSGPTGVASLAVTPGSFQNGLSWSSVSGATRYWVFRTEGHAGCEFGKTRIAETTGTTYTDTQVAAGRTYYYNVVAAGASNGCFAPVSNCANGTPTI